MTSCCAITLEVDSVGPWQATLKAEMRWVVMVKRLKQFANWTFAARTAMQLHRWLVLAAFALGSWTTLMLAFHVSIVATTFDTTVLNSEAPTK